MDAELKNNVWYVHASEAFEKLAFLGGKIKVSVRGWLCPHRTGGAPPNWLCLPGLPAPVISQHRKLQGGTRGVNWVMPPEDKKLQETVKWAVCHRSSSSFVS